MSIKRPPGADWHTREEVPAQAGSYWTAEIEQREVGPNGRRLSIHHFRGYRWFDGEYWESEHDEWSHWYGEGVRDGNENATAKGA